MKSLRSLCIVLLASCAFAAEKERALPMNTRVDSIDLATMSFTHKNKDGREVRFVLTQDTTIRNNGAAAKFADIHVGDIVAGSRWKRSDTEYEVKSITKFAPAAAKPAK